MLAFEKRESDSRLLNLLSFSQQRKKTKEDFFGLFFLRLQKSSPGIKEQQGGKGREGDGGKKRAWEQGQIWQRLATTMAFPSHTRFLRSYFKPRFSTKGGQQQCFSGKPRPSSNFRRTLWVSHLIPKKKPSSYFFCIFL